MSVSIANADRSAAEELILSNFGYVGKEAKALSRCLERTQHLWIGEAKGKPVCAWGLIPPTLLSESAYLWMITIATEGYEFVLVRHSQIEIAKMLDRYPKIIGHCEAGQDRSIRWLRWLGAVFGEPEGQFIPFTIQRKA